MPIWGKNEQSNKQFFRNAGSGIGRSEEVVGKIDDGKKENEFEAAEQLKLNDNRNGNDFGENRSHDKHQQHSGKCNQHNAVISSLRAVFPGNQKAEDKSNALQHFCHAPCGGKNVMRRAQMQQLKPFTAHADEA